MKHRRPELRQHPFGKVVGGLVQTGWERWDCEWVDDLDAYYERQRQHEIECLRVELRRLRSLGPDGRKAEREERAANAKLFRGLAKEALNRNMMMDYLKETGRIK